MNPLKREGRLIGIIVLEENFKEESLSFEKEIELLQSIEWPPIEKSFDRRLLCYSDLIEGNIISA